MAKESGINVLLKVGGGGSPETFTSLGGQRNTRLQLSEDLVDVSDKDSNRWMERIAGMRDASITSQGIAEWPDTNALALLKTAYDAGTTVNCQLQESTQSGGYWEAPFRVQQCQISGAHNGATDFDVTLALAGPFVHTPAS